MSCPYVTTQKPTNASVGITIQPIEELFHSCVELQKDLQSCRENVAKRGKGHCLEYSKKVEVCKQKKRRQENSLTETCGRLGLIRSLFEICSDDRLSQNEKEKCQFRFDSYKSCANAHLLS